MERSRARRSQERHGPLRTRIGPVLAGLVLASAGMAAWLFTGASARVYVSGASAFSLMEADHAERVSGLLKDIFSEVWELGRYPGEEFVRREFFVGEGDDDTYKDFHLVVLIQDVPGGRKMILQVTRMVPDPDRPRVKYGRDPKSVVCVFGGGRPVLARSDYSEKELSSVLPDLLRAIRDRKKLVRDKT